VYNSSEYDSEYDDSLEAIDELPMAEENDDYITPALSNRNVMITHGGGGESSRSKGIPTCHSSPGTALGFESHFD